jgi:NUMOD4 motif
MLYLYNPRTNTKTETTYAELEKKTAYSNATLRTFKSRGQKLERLGCYLVDEHVTIGRRRELHAAESFENEVWRKVQGYGGRYSISNYGRIKVHYKKKTAFMLPTHDKSKLVIRLCGGDSKRPTNRTIASLVARHFLPVPIAPGQVVEHKNGLYFDNFAGNLRYTTKNEVMRRVGQSTAKAVVQVDPGTKAVVDEFRNPILASKETFHSLRTVLRSCQTKHMTGTGVLFMYRTDYEKTTWGD